MVRLVGCRTTANTMVR